MLMKDRVALVTGSTSGIGRVTALELARRGAKLIITSNEAQKIPEVLQEVRALSAEAEGYEADMASRSRLEEVVKQATERFGRIDILVNNAGITRDNLMIRMKDSEWDDVLNINLTSAFHLTRMVLRSMMKARYGRIISVASVVGVTGNAGQANYAASKAGLMGFTKSLAREVASRGVTANCVAPGFIQTRMTDVLGATAKEAMLAQIPLGAMGRAEDVAYAIAFLASDEAGYITGETIHVNGGMYMS
ncbi:MAG: 3-oxoacyl-[acyl-carrier-protein] reductase [Magnetococcales bacterium]|nr:3-oxoacyl-[acyl-carrier-protein] reductase [Magnetococcales bacterium]MBF0322762.1 3-oxoacyl-[acyl-carrier-protein] reductase [Magnetococcales bacterium]